MGHRRRAPPEVATEGSGDGGTGSGGGSVGSAGALAGSGGALAGSGGALAGSGGDAVGSGGGREEISMAWRDPAPARRITCAAWRDPVVAGTGASGPSAFGPVAAGRRTWRGGLRAWQGGFLAWQRGDRSGQHRLPACPRGCQQDRSCQRRWRHVVPRCAWGSGEGVLGIGEGGAGIGEGVSGIGEGVSGIGERAPGCRERAPGSGGRSPGHGEGAPGHHEGTGGLRVCSPEHFGAAERAGGPRPVRAPTRTRGTPTPCAAPSSPTRRRATRR
jgi:hypothetical protein